MVLRDFVMNTVPETKLSANAYGAAMRLTEFSQKGRMPETARHVAHLLNDTGVRGRVVDISGEKLPKVGKLLDFETAD